MFGNDEVAKLLIDAGADVNAPSVSGYPSGFFCWILDLRNF